MRSKVFNTTFENMLRLLLLADMLNAPANVDRLAALDFICIYGKKCKVLDKNLHGDNEFGFAEFINKREKITEAVKLSDHIQEVQQEIKELIEENTAIVRQMTEYQQEDANCRVLLDRYESLISQYKSDLQRLNFISKGEQAVKGLPENGVCSFCGGELHPEDDDSYIEAINAEIKRIASELTVIAATENSVREEQETIRKSIEEFQVRRTEINKALDDKNREIQNYRSGLQRFRDYTTL